LPVSGSEFLGLIESNQGLTKHNTYTDNRDIDARQHRVNILQEVYQIQATRCDSERKQVPIVFANVWFGSVFAGEDFQDRTLPGWMEVRFRKSECLSNRQSKKATDRSTCP
jgi:hypothetical protein